MPVVALRQPVKYYTCVMTAKFVEPIRSVAVVDLIANFSGAADLGPLTWGLCLWFLGCR